MPEPVGDPNHGLPELFIPTDWDRLADRFRLSRRQRQIARLICLARTNRQIARSLGIGPDVVAHHNRQLYSRLDVHGRVGMVVRLVLAHCEISVGSKHRHQGRRKTATYQDG